MPGHRDYIVYVTMEIDAVKVSGKGIWSRSGGRVADPEELARAIEGTFREMRIGPKFILRETKVAGVHPSFNIIAEIARVATQSPPKSSATRKPAGPRRVPRRRKTS